MRLFGYDSQDQTVTSERFSGSGGYTHIALIAMASWPRSFRFVPDQSAFKERSESVAYRLGVGTDRFSIKNLDKEMSMRDWTE